VSGEAVSLAIVRGRDAIIVQRFETKHILRAEIGVGTRMPLLSCASGKFLLAHMPESQVDTLYPGETLPRVTAHSVRSKKKLKAMFPAIRDRGYAVNDNEYADGVAGIATGVTDSTGNYVAALSIAGPASRFQGNRWVEPLARAAHTMSGLLAGKR
jgi:DNA-binding IclR family transcriptional regulator